MFETDSDGNLIFIDNHGDDSVPADNLFSVPESPSLLDSEEEALQDSVPDASFPPSPDSPYPVTGGLDVSGGDLSFFDSDKPFTMTTSGDIYVYPDHPENLSLETDRSVSSADVTGLPNATSLQYLEDVARGYPSWYKYMAFKSDANYSQSMVLYIAASGEKNPSSSRMDFKDVDRIEINYIRSGNTYYYQYKKSHYASYQVPYNTNVFLYTNVIDGYAHFDIKQPYSITGILFVAAAVALLSLILRGGGKS